MGFYNRLYFLLIKIYLKIAFGFKITQNDSLEFPQKLITNEIKPFISLGISLLPSKFTCTFLAEQNTVPVQTDLVKTLLIFTKRVFFYFNGLK